MHKNWPAMAEELTAAIKEVRLGAPDVTKAFSAMAQAATAGGALDTKTKELIALAIGITARCDGCLAYHAKAAAKYGASREEILETIGVAVYMGGGPSMIYGAEALAAFDAFAPSAPQG